MTTQYSLPSHLLPSSCLWLTLLEGCEGLLWPRSADGQATLTSDRPGISQRIYKAETQLRELPSFYGGRRCGWKRNAKVSLGLETPESRHVASWSPPGVFSPQYHPLICRAYVPRPPVGT